MKKMQIFEPAMCCSTGLCGVGADPELLRISTVLNTLEKKGIKVDRYNLSGSPQVFVTNKVINAIIKEKGAEVLPVVTLDEEIVITGRYPTNEECISLLNLPENTLGEQVPEEDKNDKSEGGCCCCGGDCN